MAILPNIWQKLNIYCTVKIMASAGQRPNASDKAAASTTRAPEGHAPRLDATLPALLESPIARHEWLKHVRDEGRRIDVFTISAAMKGRIAVEVGLQGDGTREGQLDDLGLGQRPQPQLLGRVHREAPRLKNSGWYGRSTRSRLTMMRTGRP